MSKPALGVVLVLFNPGLDSTFFTRSSKVLSLSLATEEVLRILDGWCSGVTSVTLTGVAGVLEGELVRPGVVEAIAVVLEGVPDPDLSDGFHTGSLERPATESSKSFEIPIGSASLEAVEVAVAASEALG